MDIMDIDLSSELSAKIAEYCSSTGDSVDQLCSKIHKLNTAVMAVKGIGIAAAAYLVSALLGDLLYGQVLLAIATAWFMAKYTAVKDQLIEDIIKKNYAEHCMKSSSSSSEEAKEDQASSASEDPDDVPAPLS